MDILEGLVDHRTMMSNSLACGFYESDELREFGFGAVGRNVKVSKDCMIVGLSQIFLGNDIRIDSRAAIIATTGRLRLAGQNHISGGCHLAVAADLTIGLHSGFSHGVKVLTSADDYADNSLAGSLAFTEYRDYGTHSITIGNYCVFGAGTVILPGCSAGDGAAVGALSLVAEPLAEWTLYHGSPAQRVRDRGRHAEALGNKLSEDMAKECALLTG